MTGTQQPPLSNWQPAPAGQPAMPVQRKRRRRALLIGGGIVVLIVLAVIGGLVAANQPKGSLTLPARLLGLPRVNTAGARHLANQLRAAESRAGGKISGVVAGVYGNPAGAWVALSGGGICGTCAAKSAATQRRNLAASGYPDATSFPAGPKGGVMACGTRASQGSSVIRCTWVDGQTAGNMLFADGAAASLADAATQTIRARAAAEH